MCVIVWCINMAWFIFEKFNIFLSKYPRPVLFIILTFQLYIKF